MENQLPPQRFTPPPTPSAMIKVDEIRPAALSLIKVIDAAFALRSTLIRSAMTTGVTVAQFKAQVNDPFVQGQLKLIADEIGVSIAALSAIPDAPPA